MSDQFWLSEEQLARIKPYFPLSHGVPRVDERRVISGIIHVIRNGCAGGMRRRPTDRIKLYITGSYVGRRWAFSTRYLLLWCPKTTYLNA